AWPTGEAGRTLVAGSEHRQTTPKVCRHRMSALPSPLKSPTPAMVQSLDTVLTMPPPLMVVPFSSHRPRAPEVWRHRMSAVPSPLKSRSTVAAAGPPRGKSTVDVRTPRLLHPPPAPAP